MVKLLTLWIESHSLLTMAKEHGHTSEQGFGEDDLLDLVDALYPVSKNYLYLGLQIGVKKEDIDKIKYNDSTMCLLEVIKLRLRQSKPLTWSIIEQALRSGSMNESQLAKNIQEISLKVEHEQASFMKGEIEKKGEDKPSHDHGPSVDQELDNKSYKGSEKVLFEQHFSENDLGALDNVLYPICNKCVFFGLLIGICKRDIEIIETQHEDPRRHLLEILSLRLKQAKPLTRGIIDKALRSRLMNESRLADELLKNKYTVRFEEGKKFESRKQWSAGYSMKEEDDRYLVCQTVTNQTQEQDPTINEIDRILTKESECVTSQNRCMEGEDTKVETEKEIQKHTNGEYE